MSVVQARTLTEEEGSGAKPLVRVEVAVNNHVVDNDPTCKLKRIWDNYKVIGEVQKTSRKKIVVAAAIRDGVKNIYLREWHKQKGTEEWFPNASQGITIPILYPIMEGNKIVDTIIPFTELADLLFETAEALEDMYLYDDEAAVYVEHRKKGRIYEKNKRTEC